jgi:hypothetical protein
LICLTCSRPLHAGARFCGHCGSPIPGASPGAPPPRAPSPVPVSESDPTSPTPADAPEPIGTLQLQAFATETPDIPTGTLDLGSGWRFRIVAGANQGRLYSLKGAEMLIGRDSARCQIQLGESMVSRQHAVLLAEGKGWRIRRLSTSSPLYVNGESIEDVVLKPGDLVQVGSTIFVAEGL